MKKYKNYLKIAAIGCLMTGLWSCDLDEYNPGGSTADNIYKSQDGYNALINSAYAYWGGQLYGREDPVLFWNGGSDEWINIANGGYGRQMSKYQDMVPGTGQLGNTWQRLYEIINDCNAAIERVDGVTWVDTKMRDIRLGEAKFMRAFAYWHLVENFGNVVLRTTETKTMEENCYRSTYEELYKLMFDDLNDAKTLLVPDPYPTTDVGRATQKAAYGLLARVALTYVQYCETQQEKDKYYEMAEEAAKYVIDHQAELKVSLYGTPAEVYAKENNKTNKEAMFVITHSTEPTNNMKSGNPYRLHGYFHAKYTGWCGMTGTYEYGRDNNSKAGSMCMMPTKHLLNLYNEDIDARYNAWFRENYYQVNDGYTWTAADLTHFEKPASMEGQPVAKGELMLQYTKKQVADKRNKPYAVVDIDDTYDPITGAVSTNANFNIHFPTLLKFEDGSIEQRGLPYTSELGSNDVFVMRLPEMYFIVAECEVMKTGGNKQTAADYLNVIRWRAAQPGHKDDMTAKAADMTLDFILDERSRELCGEHIRWFDLKRTRKIVEYIKTKNYNPDVAPFVSDKCYLRPIPQSFLNSINNSEEFGQNPHW